MIFKKLIIGKIISIGIAVILIIASITKIFTLDFIEEHFIAWNLSEYIIIIGILELIFALIYITPKLMPLGTIFLSVFMGGAIATHLINNELTFALFPLLFLILIWTGSYLRYPRSLIIKPNKNGQY